MKPYMKFVIFSAIIVGTLAWLAVGGINETKSYYKTVAELKTMGDDVYAKRLRVAGDVADDSIVRNGREVKFMLKQEAETIAVVYNGIEPLPDTFRDGAQAVADGKMGRDGVFQANKIQAKCASKYEGKPGEYQKEGKPAVSMPASKAAF